LLFPWVDPGTTPGSGLTLVVPAPKGCRSAMVQRAGLLLGAGEDVLIELFDRATL
jgi:hypothetical protein